MLNELITSNQSTINEVIKKIEINKKGIIFVVDSKNRINGSIADGDVRRAIIKKINFENKATKILNRNFVILRQVL